MVLAVGEGVPQVGCLVAAIIAELLRLSQPETITVVCAPSDQSLTEADLTAHLSAADRDRVHLVRHDPHDREACAYVAANRDAQPIYLNRCIVDADFVVPVGCLRADEAAGYLGVHSVLYPRFADERTQRRFRDPKTVSSSEPRQRQRREVEEAAWLLGVQFTVQVLPGAQDTVLHVWRGWPTKWRPRGTRWRERPWNFPFRRRRAWSWPRSTGTSGSKPGTISPAPWRPPGEWSPRRA